MTGSEYIRKMISERPATMAKVVGVSFMVGLLESSGIALFIPLLQMLERGGDGQDVGRIGQLLQSFFGFFGIPFTLGYLLAFIFLTVVGVQMMMLLQAVILFRARYRYEADLRHDTYKTMFAADWPFFLKQKLGDLTNTITVEVTRAGTAFQNLVMVISVSLTIFAYLVLAILMSWEMTAVASVIGVVVVIALQKQVGKARGFGQAITQANTELQSEALEQFAGAKIVKSAAVEEASTKRFKKYLESLRAAYYKSSISQATVRAVYEPLAVGILCIIIYIAVTTLHMPIAKLVVFLFLFYRLSPRLSQSQTYRHSLNLNLPAIVKVEKLAAEANSRREESGSHEISAISRGIVFENIDFMYEAGHPIIKNLNIEVPAGQITAVVGGSGAGKSTVIDLIMGLLVPNNGAINVDGIPLSEVDLVSWRRMISYVPQDTVLFHASVRENITWTSPDASEAEVVEAAREAYALEFIEELPQGFETIVGDRGVRLSGGQRQRLALARALLGRPKLLILDEATSALDAESEQKIQAAIDNLSQSEMTIVVVTHRLATVKGADIIYVLESGELAEKGTWLTLAESSGRFQTLKHLQALD